MHRLKVTSRENNSAPKLHTEMPQVHSSGVIQSANIKSFGLVVYVLENALNMKQRTLPFTRSYYVVPQ